MSDTGPKPATSHSAAARLSTALKTLDADTLRAAWGRLDENARRRIATVLRTSQRTIDAAADPTVLLRRQLVNTPPDLRIDAANLICGPCISACLEALGERSEDPTHDDMLEVLPALCDEFGTRLVTLMLAIYPAIGAVCTDVFEQLLDNDPRFVISDEPKQEPMARDHGSGVDDAVRARRRERKASKKRSSAPKERPHYRRDTLERPSERPASPHADERVGATAAPVLPARRPARLVLEWGDVDITDALVGRVVVAPIRFEDEPGSKPRPAVVLAVRGDALVVRACYSEGGMRARTWKSVEIHDLQSPGLKKRSWVSPREELISRADVGQFLGQLSVEDWNHLF